MIQKKLYKSRDKKVCGVCAGVAEYFEIDPTIIRVIWALVALSTGFGFVAYIVAAVILDEKPENEYRNDGVYESKYTEVENEPNDNDEIKGFKP